MFTRRILFLVIVRFFLFLSQIIWEAKVYKWSEFISNKSARCQDVKMPSLTKICFVPFYSRRFLRHSPNRQGSRREYRYPHFFVAQQFESECRSGLWCEVWSVSFLLLFALLCWYHCRFRQCKYNMEMHYKMSISTIMKTQRWYYHVMWDIHQS